MDHAELTLAVGREAAGAPRWLRIPKAYFWRVIAWKEEDVRTELLLKTRLLVDGVRIEPDALDGVGRWHKEQLHHLFEYDFDLHKAQRVPADLRLPGGSIVQVRLNAESPYVIRRDGPGLIVEAGGSRLSALDWLERPRSTPGRRVWVSR